MESWQVAARRAVIWAKARAGLRTFCTRPQLLLLGSGSSPDQPFVGEAPCGSPQAYITMPLRPLLEAVHSNIQSTDPLSRGRVSAGSETGACLGLLAPQPRAPIRHTECGACTQESRLQTPGGLQGRCEIGVLPDLLMRAERVVHRRLPSLFHSPLLSLLPSPCPCPSPFFHFPS